MRLDDLRFEILIQKVGTAHGPEPDCVASNCSRRPSKRSPNTGFSRTTLGLIAKNAGLSQGIVNFYFKSKDVLLLATLKFLAEEYETA